MDPMSPGALEYEWPNGIRYERFLYTVIRAWEKPVEEILQGAHNPQRVTGNGTISDDELRDLVAYVKSL